ncbi:MAG: tRNA uridine(34) 5-carboxymethylaminomethyl modification radical SAM/GNAT enzyme Elp3 [Crenarchaeota archaeon]|nr:tRNA uridine(34) 5-carboxymethylaminomethyl modification radical SAM/GNAT enzyme Elp3 [Thermoproteota archaeon]MDW8034081.1 tRNA uridine(34) 5-carboxymethylaminomethyl modification radical SAM/GNAT enzyme Elp3 [Nitrososphaerota archaeon]
MDKNFKPKDYWDACREIVRILSSENNIDRKTLHSIKLRVSAKFKLSTVPSNADILATAVGDLRNKLVSILRVKPSRSLSGVVVIAAMTIPMQCPHGKCFYCPGGPSRNTPQSYTGLEPATMRGIRNNYDPFKQVSERIGQLESSGHVVQKAELIIMGGTFPAAPLDYQKSFIKGCFDALNGSISQSLEEAHRLNERSKIRCVGLTVETRPDYCKEEHVDNMLIMGVTRVEIGVQTLRDDILKRVERGHSVEDTVKAFRIAKDAGLKIVAHMMPGLPGISVEDSLEDFRKLYFDDDFKPDMVKIYPTLVVEGTKLYEAWRDGKYKPLGDDEAAELVAKILEMTPPWVRVMRVQRDIPAHAILAGVKKSNLRELAHRILESQGLKCRCIRCREIGLSKAEVNPEGVELIIRKYEASEGVEYFLSLEDLENDVLLAYLRLRKPSPNAHRKEVNETTCMIVRELKTLGRAIPIGTIWPDSWQHRGLGVRLMKEAEKIAIENGAKKILVISAVGVREYYRRLGYSFDGIYMVKKL